MSKTNEVVFFQNKLFNGITIIRLSVSSRSTQIFFISLVFAPCFLRRIQKLWRRLAQRIMAKSITWWLQKMEILTITNACARVLEQPLWEKPLMMWTVFCIIWPALYKLRDIFNLYVFYGLYNWTGKHANWNCQLAVSRTLNHRFIKGISTIFQKKRLYLYGFIF